MRLPHDKEFNNINNRCICNTRAPLVETPFLLSCLLQELHSSAVPMSLSLVPQALNLPPLPVGMDRRSELGCLGSLDAKTTALPSGRGKTPHFAVLVDRLANVLHTRIVANGVVEWINKNDLVELVYGILANPVGVEHTETSKAPTYAFFGKAPQIALGLLLAYTLVLGFTIYDAILDLLLAVTALYAYTIDYETLLGLVSQTSCLVRSGWPRYTVNGAQLPVFPGPDTQQCAHGI